MINKLSRSTCIGLMAVTCVMAQKKNDKPNILVFIADDLGMDLGCYGNKGIKTPNIDRLAREGLMFTRMFLTSPQSSPSRTSMLSGQFAHTIGTEDLHVGLNDTTKLLPYYLRQAGYYTGIILKTHIGINGEKQFDYCDNGAGEYYSKGTYTIEKMIKSCHSFLEKKGDRPFFLWCAFIDPHRPYVNDPVPANRAPRITDPKDVTVPPFMIDNEETRLDLAHYYDEILRLDSHIGMIMAELEKKKLLENTLIVVLSDNGCPMPRCKGFLYDSGIQTPFIMWWKNKIPAGVKYEGLSSTIHLAPTLLEVAGIAKPPHMYGKSLVPVFSNLNTPGDEYIFSERNWHGTDEHNRCLRTKKYKMIVNEYYYLPPGNIGDMAESGAWYSLLRAFKNGHLNEAQKQCFKCPRTMIELYDLENDPYELNNLTEWGGPEIHDITQTLLKVMDQWKEDTKDFPSYLRKRSDKCDRMTGYYFTNKVYEYNEE